MKILKTRLSRFARMLSKTAEPITSDDPKYGFGDTGRAILAVAILTVPTFVAVVVFGR